MTDALDAIEDIKEAVLEYGSDITLQIVTKGAYDPDTGEDTDSIANVTMKALINTYGREELRSENIRITDRKFRFYYAGEITPSDKIIFRGVIYSLEDIDTKILQNLDLIYIIQGRV